MSDSKLLRKKSFIKKNTNPSKKSKYSRVTHVHHHNSSGWFNSECLSLNNNFVQKKSEKVGSSSTNNNNTNTSSFVHNLISEALQKQQQHKQLLSSRSVVENGSKKFREKRRRNCKSSASSTNNNDWSIEELVPALGSGDNQNQNLSKYNECITTTRNGFKNNKNSMVHHREPKIIVEPYKRNHDNKQTTRINENCKTEQFKNDGLITSTVFCNQLKTASFQYREPTKPLDLRQRSWTESPVTNLDSLISSSIKNSCFDIYPTEELNSCFEISNEKNSTDTIENYGSDGENKKNSTHAKIEDKSPSIFSDKNVLCSIRERTPTGIMSTKVLNWKTVASPPLSNEITNENRAVTYCRYKGTTENDDDDDDEEESFGSENDEQENEDESDNTTIIINPLNNVPFFDNKQFGDCENNNVSTESCEIKKFNTCTSFFEKYTNSSELNTTTSRTNPLVNTSEDSDQNTTTASLSLKIFPEWIENPDGIDISYCPELKLDCLIVDKPRLNVVEENLESIQQQKQEIETKLSDKLSSTALELESKVCVDDDDECHGQSDKSNSTNSNNNNIANHLYVEPLLLIEPVLQGENFEPHDHTNSLDENIENCADDAFQLELENLRKESFKYGEKVHLIADTNETTCVTGTAICETSDSLSSFQGETFNNIQSNKDDGLIQSDTDDESIEKLFVSPRLHEAPSSTTIILSTNYLSSTNILHSVDYEPLIDEEIYDDDSEGECLFIQAGSLAITGTTINHHHHHHNTRVNNINEQIEETDKPKLNGSLNKDTCNYQEINFETINNVSNNDPTNNNNNNTISIKLSGTSLNVNGSEQQQFEKSLELNNSQIFNENNNVQQREENKEEEYYDTPSPSQVNDPINFNLKDKILQNEEKNKYISNTNLTLVLGEESTQSSIFSIDQRPCSKSGDDENGIIQTKLYENEAVFLWESEIDANESSSSSSNDTYVVELKRQSTDLTSLFSVQDNSNHNEIKIPSPISEETSCNMQSCTQTFEKSCNSFHRKDRKKKRVLNTPNGCEMKTSCINNSKNSKSNLMSHKNNNNNCTTKKLNKKSSTQNRNKISSSLLLPPNLKSNDYIPNRNGSSKNNNCRRLQNSKIPISTKKYLENCSRKMGKEKRKGSGYHQSSSLVSAMLMGKYNVPANNSNNVLKNEMTITNKTRNISPDGTIPFSSLLDFTETIQEPPLKLISVEETCSVNIKNENYPKFQCITKIELDPFVVVRIPSFEIVNQSSHHHVHCTTTSKYSKPLIEINSHSNENDHSFDNNNYSIPDLLPSSTFNANQESLKIMKEAENFLTEYRKPGSLSFVEKLPQFAAFYDLLQEQVSNDEGEHRPSLVVQSVSSSTRKVSDVSNKVQNTPHPRSKHKEKMAVTITRKRKFPFRKCISRRFRWIFRCCYSKKRKESHCSKVYSHQSNLR